MRTYPDEPVPTTEDSSPSEGSDKVEAEDRKSPAPPVVDKDTKKEKVKKPKSEPKTEVEETVEAEDEVVEETTDTPEEEVKEEPAPKYVEIDYADLDTSDPFKSLPKSDTGNYIIVYSTTSCPYCEKLLSELKDKTEAYIQVVVKCPNYHSRDLFYRRTISYFPSWVIIKNNRVTYYGNGYYSWESFKRML